MNCPGDGLFAFQKFSNQVGAEKEEKADAKGTGQSQGINECDFRVQAMAEKNHQKGEKTEAVQLGSVKRLCPLVYHLSG